MMGRHGLPPKAFFRYQVCKDMHGVCSSSRVHLSVTCYSSAVVRCRIGVLSNTPLRAGNGKPAMIGTDAPYLLARLFCQAFTKECRIANAVNGEWIQSKLSIFTRFSQNFMIHLPYSSYHDVLCPTLYNKDVSATFNALISSESFSSSISYHCA